MTPVHFSITVEGLCYTAANHSFSSQLTTTNFRVVQSKRSVSQKISETTELGLWDQTGRKRNRM